jgi:hypothetical protein
MGFLTTLTDSKWHGWHASFDTYPLFIFSIAIAPPFAGLHQFPDGRGFKQWTGDDSKALMKVRSAR